MWDAVYVGYYDRRGPDGTLWPGLRSLDAVLERLAEAERAMTDDGPLLAWGFDPIFFGTARLTAHELDRVSAQRPIAILHASVHLMNVNGAMLARAGIDEDTDIDGVTRDVDGRPTGELQEFAAMLPVYQTIGGKLAISASEAARRLELRARRAARGRDDGHRSRQRSVCRRQPHAARGHRRFRLPGADRAGVRASAIQRARPTACWRRSSAIPTSCISGR